MQVQFSVGDNDTHHRSAIFQHNMDTSGYPHNRSSLGSMMPTTTLSDPPLPEPVIPLFGSHSATLILHSNITDIAAPAQQMTNRQPKQPEQAYFTHLLPAGLTKWRAYPATALQAATCHQRASFIRYMAKTGRYPRWSTGLTPPAGVVTTQMGAIKLVNFRKQSVIASMNLVASILDDCHASLDKEAKKLFDELKVLYAQQNAILELHQQYSFKSAIELATKLVEREAASLDSNLRSESDVIKKCPEAALWVGIPTNLVPPEVINSQSNTDSVPSCHRENSFVPKPATFLDMLKIGQQKNMASLSHVSPLNAINPTDRNQIFTASWGAPTTNRQGEFNGQNKRRAPYQGHQNNRQNQS